MSTFQECGRAQIHPIALPHSPRQPESPKSQTQQCSPRAKPVTGSMFMSLTLPKEKQMKACLHAHHAVQESLRKDAANFAKTYSAHGIAGMARYNIPALPQTPQHKKFSRLGRDLTGDSSASSGGNIRTMPKFNIPKLRKWFKEIDVDGSGRINRQELFQALRNQPELQSMITANSRSSFNEAEALKAFQEKSSIELKDSQAAEDRKKRIVEIKRLSYMFHELDKDNSGYMDWEEFEEFFRRAGYILEYQTRDSLNDNSFKHDGFLEVVESQMKLMKMEAAGISSKQVEQAVEEESRKRSNSKN